MNQNFKHSLNQYAVRIGLVSLALVAFCMLVLKRSSNTGLVGIGYWITIVIAGINTLLLLVLVINSLRYFKDYTEHGLPLLLVLANVPSALYYLELI